MMTIHAQTESDGSAILTVDGRSQKIRGTGLDDARAKVRDFVIQYAFRTGEAVDFASSDPAGEFFMVVHPDGLMENASPPEASDLEQTPDAEPEAEVEVHAAPLLPRVIPSSPTVSSARPLAPVSRQSLRETTFLTSGTGVRPATKGARRLLRYVGISAAPSAAELAERDDIRMVSQHWPGARTIAVVNRKGGANKTPTVACLSAVFARYGGGGVLAWDNNENTGTLGWRTEQGPHSASVLDLVRDDAHLLAPSATQALMAGYVHHQTEDKYDVLRSDENNEGDHEIEADEVHRAHAVAERYYRMIVMDSGNTTRAANWRAMINHTHQLVVPVTTMEDRAEGGKLTLQTLADRPAGAQLASNAVVIISQWKAEDRAEAQRIADLFTPLVRSVVTVPYDPALKAGRIHFEALRPATQRAWLAAAAEVARGLG